VANMIMSIELKKDALAALMGEIQNYAGGRTLVWGHGSLDARLVIIGEAPGRQEEVEGQPFVGMAGQLLNEMLENVGLNRKEIWITNLVKWRPARNNPAHSTRPPSINEIKLFTPWLWAELRIVDPSVVLCLGRASAQAVIERELQMDRDHGCLYNLDGFVAMATYHPAYVLRWGNRRDDHTMRLVIEDLRKIIGLYRSVRGAA
jgi:uracil-DNA glycosylase